MLHQSFCMLPGVGLPTEQRWWLAGVTDLHQLANHPAIPVAKARMAAHKVPPLADALEAGELDVCARALPSSETWRLAVGNYHRAAFLDIETTGMGDESHITAIALAGVDAASGPGFGARTYVHGDNLEAFADDILHFDLLVTYNGRCFDVPVIERELAITLPKAHVDLRFALAGIGVKGGLKGCEKCLGLDRDDGLEGLDGYFAVLLWEYYQNTGDARVLETLLAYNVADVLSLPHLLHHVVCTRLAETPFATELACESPKVPANPHTAHRDVVAMVRGHYGI